MALYKSSFNYTNNRLLRLTQVDNKSRIPRDPSGLNTERTTDNSEASPLGNMLLLSVRHSQLHAITKQVCFQILPIPNFF